MFAPAWQTTARAGLRSKLAALVVRRQAPPNPRRGEVEAPLSKGDSPLRGEMSRSDRGARARRAVSEADGGIVSSVWQVGLQFHTPHFPGGSACPGRRRTRSFV